MKKIMAVFIMSVMLISGCSTQEAYVRSEQPGEVISITLSEMEEMMSQKESFAVAFVTSYCMYCAQFHAIFDEYIKDHEVVLYQVMLDDEETTPQENLAVIHQYFPEFSTTPGIFYAENGKEKDYLDIYHLGISEEVIDEWVTKLQLDQSKKEEE